jgi:hypothetical protein
VVFDAAVGVGKASISLYLPAVGVPLMVPAVASNVSPAGNAGVTDHFSGGVKPVVCKIVGVSISTKRVCWGPSAITGPISW